MLLIVVLSYSGLCAYSVNTCKGVACVLTCILWFCYYIPLLLLLSFSHPRRVIEVTNFSTSWSDGKAFCAVIYDYNAKTFSYSELEGKEPKSWLEYAFWFAHEKVSVERLLDTEGVCFLKLIVIT